MRIKPDWTVKRMLKELDKTEAYIKARESGMRGSGSGLVTAARFAEDLKAEISNAAQKGRIC